MPQTHSIAGFTAHARELSGLAGALLLAVTASAASAGIRYGFVDSTIP